MEASNFCVSTDFVFSSDLEFRIAGLGGPLCARPNGIADVAVNTGRSPRFIGVGAGVEVLGGSQRIGSCWAKASGGGPSGW